MIRSNTELSCFKLSTVISKANNKGHIICVTSQKGEVGKTTAINLSTALAVAEKKPCWWTVTHRDMPLRGWGLTRPGFLKTLPARIELFRAEVELISKFGKEKILQTCSVISEKHLTSSL